MNTRVLVADDSQTIQKVIKITLASEPFEIQECLSPDDLEQKLETFNPNVVILDFNLSSQESGYELSKKIKSFNKNAAIFMLYGTFDTIDEEKLVECGSNYHIIKPFDGTKFINLCRMIVSDIEEIESTNNISNESENDDVFELSTEEEESLSVVEESDDTTSEKSPQELSRELFDSESENSEFEIQNESQSVEETLSDEDKTKEIVLSEKESEEDIPEEVSLSDDDLAFPDEIENDDYDNLWEVTGEESSNKEELTLEAAERLNEVSSSETIIDIDEAGEGTQLVETGIEDAVEESRDFDSELEDWSSTIPPIIDESEKSADSLEMPGVIEQDEEILNFEIESTSVSIDKEAFPSDEDLEYPEDLDFSNNDSSDVENNEDLDEEDILEDDTNSELETTSEFKSESDEEKSLDKSSPAANFQLPVQENSGYSVNNIEEALSSLKPSINTEEVIEEIVNSKEFNNLIENTIVNKFQDRLQEILEKRISEEIEKISWEIIPELAENMIAKELKAISDQL